MLLLQRADSFLARLPPAEAAVHRPLPCAKAMATKARPTLHEQLGSHAFSRLLALGWGALIAHRRSGPASPSILKHLLQGEGGAAE